MTEDKRRTGAGERGSEILGALPHTRPQRRSGKRPAQAQPAPTEAPAAPQTAEQRGRTEQSPKPKQAPKAKARPKAKPSPKTKPSAKAEQALGPKPSSKPEPARKDEAARRSDPLATVVQTAAEVAEIGLNIGTRALRGAISRLPRP